MSDEKKHRLKDAAHGCTRMDDFKIESYTKWYIDNRYVSGETMTKIS